MGLFRRYHLLLTVVLFFLSLQVISFRIEESGAEGGVYRALLALNYYPQKALSAFAGGLVRLWDGYVDLVGVKHENTRLRDELRLLRVKTASISEAELERERLKRLLSFKRRVSYELLSANVIGASPSALRSEMLIIDRGRNDGVSEGMPVTTAVGMVGRVFLAGADSSEVVLITDGISAVDAYVRRTRQRGIVKGTGKGCTMEYLGNPEEVAIGDDVVSSGKDGFYPKGVVIGAISEVDVSKAGVVRATVMPGVDLSKLEEVLVILRPAGVGVER